ncbi:type I-E CRISPR-associated protein Cse1/CasA [Streptomyces sp. HNM0663]|uniref:Type I-E CRISPR-associated protein Cse1/CasA n=1 Tax=Streptomyces chengmaiensis TaxID=3040919 RepID=A0ABT6HU32_9ACTN|nr:type I-E CRISPR-associated protein Cse1/CasA [Streptomyces chengmaiensis]MDH2392226.1 type I-E CRISPR-associated protein Cse1/CasA [Streptomyces chengmaiensis]
MSGEVVRSGEDAHPTATPTSSGAWGCLMEGKAAMDANGDLVHGAVLTAVDVDGSTRPVGLLGALSEAHRIRRLELPVHTMLAVALRQLLLPIVFDALGVPCTRQEWGERFRRGRFSEDEHNRLEEYLGPRYGDRFRLFDAERPFAQVADLQAANGETKPAAQLVQSVASGNNVPMFSALSEADELLLTPGDAVLWLLHVQCWDTASIKTGAEGDPQVKKAITSGNPPGPLGQLGVIVPTGATLYETLLLNTPIFPDGLKADDRPQWAWDERPAGAGCKSPAGPEWSERPVSGLLDLLTFQSRRIRLFPCETESGLRVNRVIVSAGDRLARTPETEPHTAWQHTAKPKKNQPHQRPRRHTSGRAAWQGLATLLAMTLPAQGDGPYTSLLLRQIGDLQGAGVLSDGYLLGVETSGLEYGTQSAVVENAIGDDLPLPVKSLLAQDEWLRRALLECVEQADQVARALDSLNNDLRRASGGDPLPRDKGSRPSAQFLHALDRTVRRLLVGLRSVGEDDDELLERAQLAWEQSVRMAADREAALLLAATPPRAAVGRAVKNGDKEFVYRSGKAIGVFRTRVAEILERATQERHAPAKEALEV